MTLRAIWNGTVLAESDATVAVVGNHYFPAESLRGERFAPSDHRSVGAWKGVASYRSVVVDGQVDPDAAWEYEHPSILARKIKGHVAFWRGVDVVSVDPTGERTAG